MNNIERNINVIYQLFSNPFGLKSISEPMGYDNDTRSYERDSDSRGFTIKTNIDLEFFGNGADYLYNLVQAYGINEKCTLTKYERDLNSLSESFKIRYIQEIDLGTLKRDSRTGKVIVNATTGGLYDDIKNRESDEYDLINELSADNEDIGAIKTVPFAPQPRSLFLESLLEKEFEGYRLNTVERDANNEETRAIKTIPLEVVYKSGDRVQTPYNSSLQSNPNPDSESLLIGSVTEVGNIFFWRSDVIREEFIFTVDLKYTITKKFDRNIFPPVFNLVLIKSKKDVDNAQNDLVIERTVLQTFNYNNIIGQEQIFNNNNQAFNIRLEKDESVGFCIETYATTKDNFPPFTSGSVIQLYIDFAQSKITIEDTQDYASTTSRAMKPLDFFNRIVQKITSKDNLVVSSIFREGGEYENILIDNGFWARGFPDNYKDSSGDEQSLQLKTSFKDAFESLNYLEPLCWFTFFDGNVEKIRIEKATYTQQNFIGLDLSNVDNINSEISKIDFFSNIEIGHTQSMEYEEVSGLDEPNGLSKLSTFINRSKSTYTATSKIRTDAVGYELIRRKNYLDYSKEDTSRDSNLWMHDAKPQLTGVYTHNLWNDSINGVQLLDELPKGVFRPDNLWNFRLSPMNRLFYGHSYSVKRGLYHFPKKSINFSSSNSNQNLITVSSGITLKENGSLLIENIPKPKVEAEMIDFTFKMTQEIEDRLLSFTKFGNDLVPNYFGLIKYIEKGEDKYGRLVKLDSSDEAKISLIKARL